MTVTWKQDDRSYKITTPLGADKLYIESFSGHESISEPFCFTAQTYSTDSAIDLAKLVGKKATIHVNMDDGKVRYINGIVSCFTLTRTTLDKAGAYYDVELRPWLWLLKYRGGFRIYEKKDAKEIIKDVIEAAGFSGDLKTSLSGTYEKREYCVQYGETDFDFICRLMEEEGIFYWFEHADGEHKLVLADDSSNHKNCPELHKLRYHPVQREHKEEDDVLHTCRFEHAVVPRGFGVNDYNFETPSTDLAQTSTSSRKSKTTYAVSETTLKTWPGRYDASGVGTKFAKTRLQALELPERLLVGEGSCRSLIAGYKITLSKHARDDVNGDWVIRDLFITGAHNGYTTRLTAFPADIPFRPPMVTPKPRIFSTQTALVTGPDGEEIHTDKYGRVLVTFHWASEEEDGPKDSCWIRVAQGWAGKSWGTLFLPRVGQEVVVSFLDGDPDRPLITGAVYNGENLPPYLPGEKTKSTIKSRSSKDGAADNFNELRFEDKKGEEEVYFQAEKDYNALIKNDSTTTIEGNKTLTVEKDVTRTVKGKETDEVTDDASYTLKAKKTTEVTGDVSETYKAKLTTEVTADVTQTYKAKRTLKVTGAGSLKYSANLDEDVGGNYTLKVGGNLSIKATGSVTIEGMSISIKGQSKVDVEGAMATFKGSGTCETSGGGMMTVKGGLVKIN